MNPDRGWLLVDLNASPFTSVSSLLSYASQGPEGRGGSNLLGCVRHYSGITVFPANAEVCGDELKAGRDAMNSQIQKPRIHHVLVSSWVNTSASPWILMPHFSPVWSHPFSLLCFCSWHLDKYSSSIIDRWNHIFRAFLASPWRSQTISHTYPADLRELTCKHLQIISVIAYLALLQEENESLWAWKLALTHLSVSVTADRWMEEQAEQSQVEFSLKIDTHI